MMTPYGDSSQAQLQPWLEESRLALHARQVQHALSIRELEANIVRDVPVQHRSDSPEDASLHRTVGEVAVRELQHRRPRTGPALHYRAVGRRLGEVAPGELEASRLARG